MKLIELIKRIRQFYIYNDMEVIAFNNKVYVGNKEFDSTDRDDFYVDHGVLTKHNFDDPKNTYFVYVGDRFEEFRSKYKYANHFSKDEYYSSESDEDGIEKCCMFDHGQEYCFTIKEQEKTYIAHYDSKSSILMSSFMGRQDNGFLHQNRPAPMGIQRRRRESENQRPLHSRC